MNSVPVKAIQRQIIALIPVYMNVFMMGCGVGWLPNAIFLLTTGDEVRATSSQCALIASCVEAGRILFAIPAGMLADKYGRKKTTICIAVLHFFAWLAGSINTSLYIIYAGRFIVGVATAMVNATALVSIGETASPEIRGRMISVYQISMHTGSILPSIISSTFPAYKSLSWGVTCFSVVSLISMLWISETPSFLVSISKLEKAKNNLRSVRQGYQENEIDIEFEKLKKYIEGEKNVKSRISWVKFLKSKAIRKPLLIGILLNFFSILTGGALVMAYITALFPSNDLIPKKCYPLLGQFSYLFIAISVTFYIDRFPRRTIFMTGAAAMAVSNALVAFAIYFDVDRENQTVFKSILVVGNILSLLSYVASVQPMNSAAKSELYPQAVKGFCGSLGIISQALALIISYQLYSFIEEYLHLFLIYVIFSINSLILYMVIYFLLPEGRGAFLTDLQIKFREKSESHYTSNVENKEQK